MAMRLNIQRKLILFFLVVSLIPTALVVGLTMYMEYSQREEIAALELSNMADKMYEEIVKLKRNAENVSENVLALWNEEIDQRLDENELIDPERLRDVFEERLLRQQQLWGNFFWRTESELERLGLELGPPGTAEKGVLVDVGGDIGPEQKEAETPRNQVPQVWVGNILELKFQERVIERVLIGYPVFTYEEPFRFDQEDSLLRRIYFRPKIDTANVSFIDATSPLFRSSIEGYPWQDDLLVDGKKVPIERMEGTENQGYFVPLRSAQTGDVRAVMLFQVPVVDAAPSVFWREFRLIAAATIPATVLISIITGVYLSRRIARPVRYLSRRAIAISRGNLDQTIEVKSNDEVGDLARAFQRMQSQLRESFDEIRQRAETIEQQNLELDRIITDLHQEQAYVENILRTVSNGVITVDTAGTITRMNADACETLGVEDATGQSFGTLLEDDSLAHLVQRAIDEERVERNLELNVQRKDGASVPLSASTALLRGEGEIIGVVLSFSDLSGIKALQERVQRQERLAALGSLSAGVAHEIRNPLGIIKGSAEILKRRFGGNDGEDGLCDDILEEVTRLSRVVTEFLEFARPREPFFEEVRMDDILGRALDLASSQAGERVTVERELRANGAVVNADPEQCRQVFLNLILNAFDAMPDGGVLTVRSFPDGERRHVVMEFRDTGVGISDENLPQVFNPFFTTKAKGTGLGLSIVHRIVESHGGRIDVESEPGMGTAFRLVLPLVTVSESIGGMA